MKTCLQGLLLWVCLAGGFFKTVSPQAVFVSCGSAGLVMDTSLVWHMHGLDWRNEAFDPFPGGTARMHITGRHPMVWQGNEVHLSGLFVETSHALIFQNPQIVVNDFLDLRSGKVDVSELSRFRLGPSLWYDEPKLDVNEAQIEGWFGWYWERSDSSARLYPLGGLAPAPLVLRAQQAPDLGGYLDLRFVNNPVPNPAVLPLIDSTGPIHSMVIDFLEPGYWEYPAQLDPLSCLGGKWQLQAKHPMDPNLPVHQLRLLGWNDAQGWFVWPHGQYQEGDSAFWVMDPTSISNTDSSSFQIKTKLGIGIKDPDQPLHPWLDNFSYDCIDGLCGSLLSWAGAAYLVFEQSKDLINWQKIKSWYPPYTDFCYAEKLTNQEGYVRLVLVFPNGFIEKLWIQELPCKGIEKPCIPWFKGNVLQVPCGQQAYTLFDMQGRELYSGNLNQVELPSLPSGVYVWRSNHSEAPAWRLLKP